MSEKKKERLLVIDVGNTNITCGVFDGEEISATFRLMTGETHTSDEYGVLLRDLLQFNQIFPDTLHGVIVASVVPKVMHALMNAIIKYIGKEPYIVGPGIKTGLKITSDNPKEIGPDLIVDCVAASELYGMPVLAVDFGTATTYILVNDKGELCAGAITPGIRISAKALWEDTARLPEIEIKKPESILGRNTVDTMQAGLVYGQIGQSKYIISEMKRESGYADLKVVATGGLGRMISEEVAEIDVYDPQLTLKGLKIIYEKNRHSKPRGRESETE
ncbi:MAG: type III pantothenate kinase [Lachnospiraceae bacterium]|nr:type III pantothenate kinase [Lachnospiraceae bacterium]